MKFSVLKYFYKLSDVIMLKISFISHDILNKIVNDVLAMRYLKFDLVQWMLPIFCNL
ncbi:hypothetical protein Dalu01_02390 [Deinococcus aluminii]|uniref:Uncharacterized protein n=1 Tax=Deinococcus aluminii TaxID=1656885 RepID=A0ABP9XF37_9DEIO